MQQRGEQAVVGGADRQRLRRLVKVRGDAGERGEREQIGVGGAFGDAQAEVAQFLRAGVEGGVFQHEFSHFAGVVAVDDDLEQQGFVGGGGGRRGGQKRAMTAAQTSRAA